jgi:hypothetical protein
MLKATHGWNYSEVMDSKVNAFHHILKTRIGHNEQLSKEVSDFMENQGKFKDCLHGKAGTLNQEPWSIRLYNEFTILSSPQPLITFFNY